MSPVEVNPAAALSDLVKAEEFLRSRPWHVLMSGTAQAAAVNAVLAELDLLRGARAERDCALSMGVDLENAFSHLADIAVECFNPPENDEPEEVLIGSAIKAAGEYLLTLPCTCPPGAAEFEVDACGRCQVLGRSANNPIER
jgi:hypothetical protein